MEQPKVNAKFICVEVLFGTAHRVFEAESPEYKIAVLNAPAQIMEVHFASGRIEIYSGYPMMVTLEKSSILIPEVQVKGLVK